MAICAWGNTHPQGFVCGKHAPLHGKHTQLAIHVIVDLRLLKGAKLSSKSLKQRVWGEPTQLILTLRNHFILDKYKSIQLNLLRVIPTTSLLTLYLYFLVGLYKCFKSQLCIQILIVQLNTTYNMFLDQQINLRSECDFLVASYYTPKYRKEARKLKWSGVDNNYD